MPEPATPPADIEAELRTPARHLAMIFDSARDMMRLAKLEPGAVFRIVSINRPYAEAVRAAGFAVRVEAPPGRTFEEACALFGFDAATAAEISGGYEEGSEPGDC